MPIYINGTPGYVPAAMGTSAKGPVPDFEDVLEKALPDEGTPESAETAESEKIPCLECKVRDECQHYIELTGDNEADGRPGGILCTFESTPTYRSIEYDYTNIYSYLEIYRRYN